MLKKLFYLVFVVFTYLLIFFAKDSSLFCNKLLADFAEYWATTNIFNDGGNPYNPKEVYALQTSITCRPNTLLPMMMWNPPHIFSFTHWLKFFDYNTAAGIWFILLIVLPLTLFLLLKKTFNNFYNQKYKLNTLSIIALISSPIIFYNFVMGQISWLLLAGFVGFLYFTFKNSPNLTGSLPGGLCLAVTTLKPQLLFLPYLYLAYRSIANKELKTLNGFLLGILLLNIWPMLYNFSVYVDYIVFSQKPPIFFKTPTIGSWLQHYFLFDFLRIHKEYKLLVRMLPTILTVILFLISLLVTAKKITNKHQECIIILLLTPISLLTSPYGWTYDAVLLFPLLMLILNHSQKSNIYAAILLIANIIVYAIPKIGYNRGLEIDIWYLGVILVLGIACLFNKNKSLGAQRKD